MKFFYPFRGCLEIQSKVKFENLIPQGLHSLFVLTAQYLKQGLIFSGQKFSNDGMAVYDVCSKCDL